MNTPPTIADFEAVNWQECVRTASEKSCSSYCTLFRSEAEKQLANGNSVGADIFTRFAAWTSVRLNAEDAAAFPAPFLDAVTEADFLLLRDLVPKADDDELKARLADIAWQGRIQNRRDPDMARLAIEAYLRSSDNFASQWWEQAWRIERALQVAFSLGRGAPEIEAVWTHIETTLATINGDDDWFLSERLMQMLLEAKRGDENTYAPIAERAAQKAASHKGVGQRDKEQRYWELKARWHPKASEEWFHALQFAAETYVAEAKDEMEGFYGAPNPIGAAMHLQRAVESYRAIENPTRVQSRVEELHRLMIEVNREAQKTFESHSQTVDLSSFITQATDQVKGLSFHEALRALLLLHTSPSKATLRDQVEVANDEMVELLCSYEQVNAAGQVVARRPSLLSPDPKEREEAQIYEMFRIAAEHHALVAQALFVPAIHQMQKEHRVSLRDWAALLRHSPFVPDDRIWLFARGFQAGWEGNWDISTHLLVPQVENSIRHILKQNQVLASTLRGGVQSEQGLDQTLVKPELAALLGVNLVFDLRGLLIEKAGSYLRHRVAHGLADFDEFYAVPSVYLWWLALRLCLLPMIKPPAPQDAVQASDEGGAASPACITDEETKPPAST